MAISNPHFVDNETGAMFVLDESGWKKVAERYSRADIRGLNIDELALIHELLMQYRIRLRDSAAEDLLPEQFEQLRGIFAKIELTPYADN